MDFLSSMKCTFCFGSKGAESKGEGGTIVINGDLPSIYDVGGDSDLHDSDLESKNFGGPSSSTDMDGLV